MLNSSLPGLLSLLDGTDITTICYNYTFMYQPVVLVYVASAGIVA